MGVKKSAIIPVLVLILFSWSVNSYSEFGVTDIKDRNLKLQYTWLISNFALSTLWDDESFFLQSPDFWPPGNESFKWFLQVYPARPAMSLYLENKNKNTVTVNYKLSLGSQKIQRIETFTRGNTYDGSRTFISRTAALGSCLPNGTLIINCEISTLTEIAVSSRTNVDPYNSMKNQTLKNNLADELLTLLEDEKFSDITIVVGENEIRAHKNILAARSSVFASLLMDNDTVSNNDNSNYVIEITDVKPKIFRKLLQYIYTDKIDGIDGTIAKELLVAAIKYDVKRLEVICEDIVFNIMSIDNVIEILDIADQYYRPILKSQAMKFVVDHAVILINSSAFKMLEQSKPNLANEVRGVIITSCKSNAQSV